MDPDYSNSRTLEALNIPEIRVPPVGSRFSWLLSEHKSDAPSEFEQREEDLWDQCWLVPEKKSEPTSEREQREETLSDQCKTEV